MMAPIIDLQIEFKILIITYSLWTGSCLQLYIKNLLHSYIPAQDLRSSKKNLLAVPAFNINSHGHHAFSVLRHFFGTVFLSILEMLDHGTFLKDS